MSIYPATSDTILRAAGILRDGGIIAAPTETVYGLFADATNAEAVRAIYTLKGRPNQTPLITHVASLDEAIAIAQFDDRARALAQAFWPGPLTLILPQKANNKIATQTTAGKSSIAIRIPRHDLTLALLAQTGRPLAAPSANLYGQLSPTSAPAVLSQFGETLPFILDGGDCAVGVESTILDLSSSPSRLLRPGGITREMIENLIGTITVGQGAEGSHSGSAISHYAPTLPLRLNANAMIEGVRENLLAFGADIPPGFHQIYNLSVQGDLQEAATKLYRGLWTLDKQDSTAQRIAVMPIPMVGIGVALNDRLARASAPRKTTPHKT